MAARNKFHVKNYEQALEFLGGRTSRKYANNTYIQMNPDMNQIGVFYHGNRIVTFYPHSVGFSSCEWQTLTTKERLNWFLPSGWYLYQEKKKWYIVKRHWDNDVEVIDELTSFYDGITILNPQG